MVRNSVRKTPAARGRGRPARIQREDVVAAALEIGLDRVTMRAVARRLGVGTSSIYYHVDGIEELLDLAGDELLRSRAVEAQTRDDWESEARRTALALRSVFQRTPGLADQALRNPRWSRLVRRLNERACSALVDSGFHPADAWLALRTVADFVEASVAREQGFTARGCTDLDHVLSVEAADCPTLRAAARALGPDPQEQRFEFGLKCLLEGIRAHRELASHRTEAKRP